MTIVYSYFENRKLIAIIMKSAPRLNFLNHLRSGDIWVTGSRPFKDFDEYLLPTDT